MTPLPTIASGSPRPATGRSTDAVLVDGPSGASVTAAELHARVAAIAGWLQRVGVQRGDPVALWLPNVPPFAAVTLAAWQVGAIVAPLSPLATPREVEPVLAEAAVVVTTPAAVPDVLTRCSGPVICIGAERDGAVGLEAVLAGPPGTPVPVDENAVAARFSSSGTTGLPKTVEITHANLAAAVSQARRAIALPPGQVTLALAPFSHILGFVIELLLPLAIGARIVTMPRPDPVELLRLLSAHRVSYLAAPPPLAALLADHPAARSTDLGALRFVAIGGAPLAPAVHERLAASLPGCTITQGYGLTESTAMVSVGRADRGAPPGTVGWLVPDTEGRIVDPRTGRDLPHAEVGELWIRGPQVMQGYRDDPEATAAAITDGWLRTGDLAALAPDGLLRIVGRLKEVMKVKGFQVAPAELEQLLLGHPDIADAAILPIPDEHAGERPVALLVARPGVSLDAESVITWLAPRVAAYKIPGAAYIVASLPRTPSGKLRRRELAVPDVSA